MGFSAAMCAAILGWYGSRGAPRSAFVCVIAIGAFLVIYNIIRIMRARDALREPAKLAGFAQRQLRSHRARGLGYLVGAPIVVIATWVGMLTSSRVAMDSWAVLTAVTLFLAGGWAWWFRVVRRSGMASSGARIDP
jgi:hypothetical protein